MAQADIIKKINDRSARIVVIGIGYVGLPLVRRVGPGRLRVTGYDKDPDKVRLLNAGESYIGDIASADARAARRARRPLAASTDPGGARRGRRDHRLRPDAAQQDQGARHALHRLGHRGDRRRTSTRACSSSSSRRPTPARRARCSFRKLTQGYELGKDVFVAFSPERVDPGNAKYHTKNTPKVIGGSTPACLEVAQALYAQIIDTRRAGLQHRRGRDGEAPREHLPRREHRPRQRGGDDVAHGSASTPGRSSAPPPPSRSASCPSIPGPGLGGHCIPIDPLYLSWKLRTLKYSARFIELADAINSAMPEYVVARVHGRAERPQEGGERRARPHRGRRLQARRRRRARVAGVRRHQWPAAPRRRRYRTSILTSPSSKRTASDAERVPRRELRKLRRGGDRHQPSRRSTGSECSPKQRSSSTPATPSGASKATGSKIVTL